MKKKIIAIIMAVIMCLCTTAIVSAIGLLKPTMEITSQDGVYTVKVTGLTRSQAKDLEKIIGKYLDNLEKDYDDDDDDSYEEEDSNVVYLVRNNELYYISDGAEIYIDTVCNNEIGVDKYNNVVYINEDYEGRYIYNTNKYPTKTKRVATSAKNLVNDENVVTGIDYASGRYTKTTDSFINNTRNEKQAVIYYSNDSYLHFIKSGVNNRIATTLEKDADNCIAVTAEGNIIYVTTSGYVYEIKDVVNLGKVTSSTPSRLSEKKVVDLNITGGTAVEYVYSNGSTKKIK